jgi:hypothetical protein
MAGPATGKWAGLERLLFMPPKMAADCSRLPPPAFPHPEPRKPQLALRLRSSLKYLYAPQRTLSYSQVRRCGDCVAPAGRQLSPRRVWRSTDNGRPGVTPSESDHARIAPNFEDMIAKAQQSAFSDSRLLIRLSARYSTPNYSQKQPFDRQPKGSIGSLLGPSPTRQFSADQ